MRIRRRDVVFYSPWAGPLLTPDAQPSGGAEVQVLQLARGLAARGARVAVVTYAVDGLPATFDGVEVIAQRRPRWRLGLARRTMLLASTARTLARLDAHVIVQRAAGGTTGLVALSARLSRSRFVYSSASTVDFTTARLGYGRLAVGLYGAGVRLAEQVVVQTDEQAELCAARFGRRPVVIRSVAEPSSAPPVDRARSEGFLWIGRLARYKNPMAFLDLAAAVPEARFTMVCAPAEGDPPGAAGELRRRAAGLENLELLGPQSRGRMLERIARSTAIVSTSDFEGMPNTLLEGWARGVPALTLAHDPDGVIGREGLGRCAGGDPARLAADAREAWAARASDASRGEACREYVRTHHDPAVVIERWAEVLGLGAAQPRPVSTP